MEPTIVDVTYSNAAPAFGSPFASPAASPSKQLASSAAKPTSQTSQTSQTRQTKLYIATPCFGCMMSNVFMLSLLELQSECAKRGIECYVDFIGNESLVQRARNLLAARFLKSHSTHLLFIDADIGFRTDTVFRLLGADKDIVTAVYPKKAYDWDAIKLKLTGPKSQEPAHMMGLDYNINLSTGTAQVENGFVRVLDSATGFMMIRRGVLERMAKRFKGTLSCVNDLPGREDPNYVTEYVALFDCMIDPQNKRYLSEDYAFVRRAQEMGIEIWADVTSPLCHVGNCTFEGDLRQRFSLVYSG